MTDIIWSSPAAAPVTPSPAPALAYPDCAGASPERPVVVWAQTPVAAFPAPRADGAEAVEAAVVGRSGAMGTLFEGVDLGAYVAPKNSRTRMPRNRSQGHADNFMTPAHRALPPLMPHLGSGARIWECACGTGNLSRGLEERGHSVISTDILDGRDFLHWEPDAEWDVIVTNPPFSIKTAFIQRACELRKPWAFLLPVDALGSAERQTLYRRYGGIQAILFPYRIHFETPSGGPSSAWFPVLWLTRGLNLPDGLTFWEPPQ